MLYFSGSFSAIREPCEEVVLGVRVDRRQVAIGVGSGCAEEIFRNRYQGREWRR